MITEIVLSLWHIVQSQFHKLMSFSFNQIWIIKLNKTVFGPAQKNQDRFWTIFTKKTRPALDQLKKQDRQ